MMIVMVLAWTFSAILAGPHETPTIQALYHHQINCEKAIIEALDRGAEVSSGCQQTGVMLPQGAEAEGFFRDKP